MAVIQKEYNYMAFPQSFSRGNPIAGVLTEVDAKLEGYVAKETGKSLVADDQTCGPGQHQVYWC